MADDERDLGPHRPATLQLPEAMWRTVRARAAQRGLSASAIVTQLCADYLDASPDRQAVIDDLARQWMRPRGPARADGDGDSP